MGNSPPPGTDFDYELGGFKESSPGDAIDIYYGPVPLPESTENVVRVYTSFPNGGIGLIGVNDNPDLRASILAVEENFEDLDLTAFIRPLQSGQNDLSAFYRAFQSASGTLSGVIDGAAKGDLRGFYRAAFSGSLDLNAEIEPIPPLDLLAEWVGVVPFDLGASIEPIPSVALSGTISGVPFLNLGATLDGFGALDLAASITGNLTQDLNALIIGVSSGIENLTATIQGFVGVEQPDNLFAAWIGAGSGDLGASLVANFPADLSGTLEAVPPAELYAFIQTASSLNLSGAYSGVLPSGSLTATISSTGGFDDLGALIRPATSDVKGLAALVDGIGEDSLLATINAGSQETLNASINEFGTEIIKGLLATVQSTTTETLSGSYSPVTGNFLGGSISPIPGGDLNAIITPKVYFIDSSIPINTFPFSDLRVAINASECEFKSDFTDLHVTLSGISSGDLNASIIAIAGQYAIADEELEVLTRYNVSTEDWLPFIIEQPAIVANNLPVILTSSPFADLSASITGTPVFGDLEASITPRYLNIPLRDSVSAIEYVNTKTGERKVVSIYFTGTATTYYFSDEADTSFAFSPDDTLVITVETYDAIESEGAYLNLKENVKKCVVDELDRFNTLDEAVRFAITCALSQISSDLSATIEGRGGNKELGAEIIRLNPNLLSDLGAIYTPVINKPDLPATISGSGGFDDLSAYYVAATSTSTTTEITNTLGERFVPRLVTHGTDKVSIVLTKVTSTDTLVTSPRPDLGAEIHGVAESIIGATISGV